MSLLPTQAFRASKTDKKVAGGGGEAARRNVFWKSITDKQEPKKKKAWSFSFFNHLIFMIWVDIWKGNEQSWTRRVEFFFLSFPVSKHGWWEEKEKRGRSELVL